MQQATIKVSRPVLHEGPPSKTTTSVVGSVDVEAFRLGMAHLGGACTLITSGHEGERAGLTATAVCSVSAEPPRLLVCINRNVRAHHIILASQRLGVNVLATVHESLAKRFAGMVQGVSGEERFHEGEWLESANGVPLLRDALVSFECHVIEQTLSGTHSIFLCEIVGVSVNEDPDKALIYVNRKFVPISVN